MKYGAFGLVEVLGSCNAVMVIDQMLKTADVSFRTWNGKCGGHEVVFMSGDVSAVTAAVDAGAKAASAIGELTGKNVMPRPIGNIKHIVDAHDIDQE